MSAENRWWEVALYEHLKREALAWLRDARRSRTYRDDRDDRDGIDAMIESIEGEGHGEE